MPVFPRLPRPKPACHCSCMHACVRACVRACSEQSNAQLQWRTRRTRPESAPLQAQPKRRLRPCMRGTARTVRVKCRRFSAISTSSMPRSLHGGERQTIPPFLNSPLTWPPDRLTAADACHVARCMLSVVRHLADDPARLRTRHSFRGPRTAVHARTHARTYTRAHDAHLRLSLFALVRSAQHCGGGCARSPRTPSASRRSGRRRAS